MKLKIIFTSLIITLFLLSTATVAMAQEEPPVPYAGMENPFSWDDSLTQRAGEGIYRNSCLGCHGAKGGNISRAEFSPPDFPRMLEERPDYYFWVLSEGRLNQGMPPYQSSLSEEQRWQVLTYLHTLGGATPTEISSQGETPTGLVAANLLLTLPEEGQSGSPLVLTATLKDKGGQPVRDIPVRFFIGVDFFINDLMEIGEVMTDGDGVVVFEHTPRQAGEITITARAEGIETTAAVNLLEATERFYHPEVGLPDKTPIPEIFLGPQNALEPGENNAAPVSGLRIPGGLPLILLVSYVAAILLVWGFYFRVWYQLFRIPVVSMIRDTDTRLIPAIGLLAMVSLAALLVLIVITGPYSHPHL